MTVRRWLVVACMLVLATATMADSCSSDPGDNNKD